jgi:hypothetical protein
LTLEELETRRGQRSRGQLISDIGDGGSCALSARAGRAPRRTIRRRANALQCLCPDGSAKLNILDPELYLRQVLERIADHPIQRISELLRWNISLSTQTHSY